MRFYNRENEINLLQKTALLALNESKMTFVIGRRRVGKTSLILKAFENTKYVYLFVSKKNEIVLCEDFTKDIENQLGITILGTIKSFSVLFEYLINFSKESPFTLIIDEFQEFFNINSSVYSDLQKIWDLKKKQSRLNLIFSGSVYSLMTKIFQNNKEPLFGRADEKIFLKSFNINILKEILRDTNVNFSNNDLLAFYSITGGIAKYVELFIDKNCTTLDKMLFEILQNNSLLIDEGKNVLIDEFGKDYYMYFSILSLIASSKTSRMEIESILEKSVGGYLDKLENDFNIIKSIKPIFNKPNSRKQKYFIEDNFLKFWFRYIYKNKSAIEIGNYEYVKTIIKDDFANFSGKMLEKYFVEKLALSHQFSEIGTYWEKQNLNEIDIVAVNQNKKTAVIAEVKLNKSKISIDSLRHKSLNLINKDLVNYTIEYQSLSIIDM